MFQLLPGWFASVAYHDAPHFYRARSHQDDFQSDPPILNMALRGFPHLTQPV